MTLWAPKRIVSVPAMVRGAPANDPEPVLTGDPVAGEETCAVVVHEDVPPLPGSTSTDGEPHPSTPASWTTRSLQWLGPVHGATAHDRDLGCVPRRRQEHHDGQHGEGAPRRGTPLPTIVTRPKLTDQLG